MNPLLMFWNIQKAAVKTFVRFSFEISMVLESAGGCCESIIWNLQKAAVKTFARFAYEISMVLESAGGCCESGNTAISLFYL